MALLARLFAWLDRGLGLVTGDTIESGLVSSGHPVLSGAAHSSRPPHPFAALLSVDGGGQFLVCGADRLTLGHLRARRADLVFLADVGAEHALLQRVDSLRDGPGWSIAPLGSERVTVGGERVGAAGRRLAAGERVLLGENLEFLLRQPDPASASAVLELLRGLECAGARRLLLLAPGPGGAVRIGAALVHHVRVPGLDFELHIEWDGKGLAFRSEQPLRLEPGNASEEASLYLPFPPRMRLAFTAGRARGSHPPFGFSLEPVVFP